MAVTTLGPATTTALERYVTGTVISKDGAVIGYRQLGRGPGVILLHGAMESAASHMQLAEALSSTFTVYLPDRRGRGLSGPYSKDYSAAKDVEDMEALFAKTDAHNIFGVSSGGIISLNAALMLPVIRKAAIYEPPLFLDASTPSAILARYDREMADSKVAAALVTGMKGAQMGPPIFNALPRWLLELFTTIGMKQEDKQAKPGDVTMRALAPTLHYDIQLVVENSGQLERFAPIRAKVLLLGGSESPSFLKAALGELAKVLPQANRVEFPGLGHGGSGNADRGGKPETVAQELRRFFV